MRRLPALATTLLVLATPLAGAESATAFDEDDLRQRIAAVMRQAGPRSGAYVSEAGTGRALYRLRDTRRRIPASVQKLYTTSTALLTLGPRATLETSAIASGGVDGLGVLHGDLVLVGHGDPYFGAVDSARLARAVRTAGITTIDGAVIGDEGYFDRRRAVRVNGYDGELGGVLSALAYSRGLYGGRAQLAAGRFAARRFDAELRRAGVRSSRSARAGSAPPGAVQVAAVRSSTVAELSRKVNVPSDNFAAEMLLKGVGAKLRGMGSTRSGAAVVRQTMASVGVRPLVSDGSGLSRANRTSPRQVVRMLERVAAGDAGSAFRASLAVAGRSGTVRRRMRGTVAQDNCRVKTGTLRDVSALVGYCRARDGREIAFALLMNGVIPSAGRALQDRIAVAIARLDSATAAP
jgi:D-alanyl-D-alanine carboxypeptidase/D-alanyl-D-alanine-endopeptidase (penicillin-binding protein 4)